MSEYMRGSLWRRWDLHIHTPETKKNDQYTGSTLTEKWDNFYAAISLYVGDGNDPTKNIAVLGITDYLSIGNYEKIVNDNRLPDCVELVLPNVEMRVQPIATDSPVNIHFIFDPKIVNSLESRFFGKLSFSYGGTNFSATKDELIRLGKKINVKENDEKAYKLGIDQFVPSLDSLKEVFKDEELRRATIIGVSNSRSDGASGIAALSSYCETTGQPSQLTLVRQSIYQFVDFIFSATPCDIKYFLGQGADNEPTVMTKCGSLKPCLHGSDAHELKKIFEPNGQKYCWVKADPTFNGFRQVIYEPKDRVRISSLMPETKADYHIIDNVVIDCPGFSKMPIYLNDKLTCIIGGKSTGKSILLHNIALTINNKQVEEKVATAKTGTKLLPMVKVYWRDGTFSATGSIDNTHKIVYIPQTYLNRLSDENEETTEIDNIIQDIILNNNDAQIAFSAMEKSLQDFKSQLNKSIYDLIQLYAEILTIETTEREMGSQYGIQKEIAKLKRKKEIHLKEITVSSEDIQRYETAISLLRTTIEKFERIELEIQSVTKMETVITESPLPYRFSEETRQIISSAIELTINKANELWIQNRLQIIGVLRKKKDDLVATIQASTAIRDSLHDKIVSNEAISKLTTDIQEEEAKLEKFNEYEEQRRKKVNDLKNLLDRVSSSIIEYRKIHERFALEVNENPDLSCSDLEFSVTVPFRTDVFCEAIKNLFDNRVLKSKREIVNTENFKEEDFTPEKIKKLLIACLKKELPLVRGRTTEEAFRSILGDWFNTTYSVKMDGDPIDKMSPGKKALVLLKLLIDLADSKSPILIDQPEDDLDNRSVFDDLIPFIRKKKIDRQIIVVTHNANVVLGGDAEEIIVANQEGTNSPNKEYQFEYRSGSIENDMPIYDDDGNIENGILSKKGIQTHICDILEGGAKAFDLRKQKYHI